MEDVDKEDVMMDSGHGMSEKPDGENNGGMMGAVAQPSGEKEGEGVENVGEVRVMTESEGDGTERGKVVVTVERGKVVVTVERGEVMEAVRREASYVGSKAVTGEDPGAYERIHIGEGDMDMLYTFYGECWADLTMCLRRYIDGGVQHAERGDSFVTEVNMVYPSGFDVAQRDVTELMRRYLRNMMLYKWLTFTAATLASVYGTNAVKNLDEIREKLGTRSIRAREMVGTSDGSVSEGKAVVRVVNRGGEDVVTVGKVWKSWEEKEREEEWGRFNRVVMEVKE